MWQLNLNGTLVNSYSGLCATVQPVKGEIRTYLLFYGNIVLCNLLGLSWCIIIHNASWSFMQLLLVLLVFALGLQQEEQVSSLDFSLTSL